MKRILILVLVCANCAFAQSVESGIIGHVTAPDGARLNISVDDLLTTLGTLRHFEGLQKDASSNLLTLIDTAIKGVENGEINLSHAKALLAPLKARDSSLSEERRKDHFGFVLYFAILAAEKEIARQEASAKK